MKFIYISITYVINYVLLLFVAACHVRVLVTIFKVTVIERIH